MACNSQGSLNLLSQIDCLCKGHGRTHRKGVLLCQNQWRELCPGVDSAYTQPFSGASHRHFHSCHAHFPIVMLYHGGILYCYAAPFSPIIVTVVCLHPLTNALVGGGGGGGGLFFLGAWD